MVTVFRDSMSETRSVMKPSEGRFCSQVPNLKNPLVGSTKSIDGGSAKVSVQDISENPFRVRYPCSLSASATFFRSTSPPSRSPQAQHHGSKAAFRHFAQSSNEGSVRLGRSLVYFDGLHGRWPWKRWR